MDQARILTGEVSIDKRNIREACRRKSIAYKFLKRLFDILSAGMVLICLSPVFLVTAVAIRLNDGGPVIHKRYCVGKNGTYFAMYKFRAWS